jgi:Cu-Zn family superoxide dismutase
MRTLRRLSLAVVLVALTALAADKPKKIKVEMKDAAGKSAGWVDVVQSGKGVVFELHLKGLPAGEHAFHVHQTPLCEADPAKPADAFKSAGAHFNPTNKKHGTSNPEGPHAGDMLNFTAATDGSFNGKIENPRVTLDPAVPNSLYAGGGTALVVHGGPDDLKTDPAGNAGPRIACGVVKK